MGLIKDIKDIQPYNPYNITKEDLIGDLEGFPLGVVVRMLEEQEKARNESDIEIFQEDSEAKFGGFDWAETDDGYDFWYEVIRDRKFDVFYKIHPEYEQYDY